MVIPKAKKLPSGTWFCRVRVNGEDIGISEETEQKAVAKALAIKAGLIEARKHPEKITLSEACTRFIEDNRARLSPSTIQGYETIVKNYFRSLMAKQLDKITPSALQQAVNAECKRNTYKGRPVSAKTVRNSYAFISQVLNNYIDINTNVLLPEIKPQPITILTPEQVFNAVQGSPLELPALLSMWLSFSLSEIRGLTKSKSIKDGKISVVETVIDIHGQPIRKKGGKEITRVRTLTLPPYLAALIEKVPGDVIVPESASSITHKFYRLLEQADLPHISFHRLRHINASVMAALNIPEAVANQRGGWRSDYVRKRVYTHVFDENRLKSDALIDSLFEDIISKNGNKNGNKP